MLVSNKENITGHSFLQVVRTSCYCALVKNVKTLSWGTTQACFRVRYSSMIFYAENIGFKSHLFLYQWRIYKNPIVVPVICFFFQWSNSDIYQIQRLRQQGASPHFQWVWAWHRRVTEAWSGNELPKPSAAEVVNSENMERVGGKLGKVG